MAAVHAPIPPAAAAPAAPLLAIGWYRSTPLPDAAAEPPAQLPVAGLTELSTRLVASFDAGAYGDVELRAGDGGLVAAHRVVLRRNPQLGLDVEAGQQGPQSVTLPAGVSTQTLRAVLRAHYLEAEHVEAQAARPEPSVSLESLRLNLGLSERALIETTFGPLDADHWRPLSEAVATERFADCRLKLSNGREVPAHQVLVAGTDDGHFFGAALRWPGCDGTVSLPHGLSPEALHALVRMRYGAATAGAEEFVLEMRHFAELFDWRRAQELCEAHLEAMLANAANMDAASLLTAVTHVEEAGGLSGRLKAAALSAAVRHWSRVGQAAEAEGDLPAARCVELRALHRVRNRDGVIFGSLKEYLDAAADDLTEWERNLSSETPAAARKHLERSWMHWHQLLLEQGRLGGAAACERWREKIRAQRETMREERALRKAKALNLSDGRTWFEASHEWREVPPKAVCGQGLEYRCDMQTGRNFARLCLD